MVVHEKDFNKISKLLFVLFRTLGLIKVTVKKDNDGNVCYESSNFTIINFYLIWMGPTREDKLTFNLLILQVID